MKVSIIIHTNTGFGMKFKQLYYPASHRLIVISATQPLRSIKPEDRDYIDKIVEVSDISFPNLVTEVRSVLTAYGVTNMADVRLASCDEFALRDVALIREKLGIVGNRFNQVAPFTNKVEMKEQIRSKIRVPKFIAFDGKQYQAKPEYLTTISEELGFPIIGKPVDSAGSENVTKIHNIEELKTWAELNKAHTNFELEEFIDGDLYQCDTTIVNGKIVDMHACKYNTPVANFIKGMQLGSIVLPPESPISQKLFAFNEAALKAFKAIPDGVTHMEIFINKKDQECVFLECAARAPGAYTCPTYDKYLGMHHETIQCQIELELPFTKAPIKGPFAAWVWYPNKEGELVEIKEPITGCHYTFARVYEKGTIIKNPTKQRERAAGIIFWTDDYTLLQEEFNSLCSQDLVVVRPVYNPANNPAAFLSSSVAIKSETTPLQAQTANESPTL